MTDLIKPYIVLYTGTEIQNDWYLEPQTGHTYPAEGLSYAEFDTLEEMQKFVTDNNLSYSEKAI